MTNVIPFTATAGAELHVRAAGNSIDLRLFRPGAGPAKVPMPTREGFTIPVAVLPDLIKTLQAAEVAARIAGSIGGGQ